jgi:uncharacterized membrane protein
LLGNTVYRNGDFYFSSFLGESLGWFELNIPLIAVIPYFVMLLVAGMRKQGEPQYLSRRAKAYMCCLAVIGMGFAAAGMLLYWTPMSYNVIEGIQGRYFLPFIPLLFLAIRSERITVDNKVDNTLMFSGIWLQMAVILCLYLRVV